MTLLLTNEEVESLITMQDCIEAVGAAFHELGLGKATSRPRSRTFSPLERDHFYLFSCMDGSLPSQDIHILRLTSDHIFETYQGSMPRRDKLPKGPGGKYCGLVMLFSRQTLELLAIFQDAVLNRMMIGATSAIAAKYLSRPESCHMALLGAGWLAPAQVLGHCAVRELEQIRVFSPTREHRECLCRDLRDEVSAELIPVESVEDAVAGVDIIACATNSYQPVFDGRLLVPGQHVGSVHVAELDDLTHERADVIVTRAMAALTTWNPSIGAVPKEAAWLDRWQRGWDPKLKELGKIVAGLDKGRQFPSDITLFGGSGTGPSAGLGIQYATAIIAYRRAQERGLGYKVPTELFLETFHP